MKNAVIACADGSYSVAYVLNFESENPPEVLRRGMLQILQNQAQLDYGLDVPLTTMGCGVSLATRQPLARHRAVAAESYDFSLLRQGWRFHHKLDRCEEIPAAQLGEAAFALLAIAATHPAWPLLPNRALDSAALARRYSQKLDPGDERIAQMFTALRGLEF